MEPPCKVFSLQTDLLLTSSEVKHSDVRTRSTNWLQQGGRMAVISALPCYCKPRLLPPLRRSQCRCSYSHRHCCQSWPVLSPLSATRITGEAGVRATYVAAAHLTAPTASAPLPARDGAVRCSKNSLMTKQQPPTYRQQDQHLRW